MSGTIPVAVYAMKVPAGDIMVPAVPDFAAMFRVSMAAIDPSEEPEYDDESDKKPPRATLKMIRIPGELFDVDSEDEDDDDYLGGDLSDDSDESIEDDEVNGGPSTPKLDKDKKKALAKALAEDDDEEMDDDDEEEMSEDDAAAAAMLKKIMKGKGKAVKDGDASSSDDDEDEGEDSLDLEEIVLCTLDPEKHYQQALDFVVGEDERIFFKVSGTHAVHLTGNYVIPADDGTTQLYDDEDEDEEEYDLSPDEDELDALEDEDEESDELDDLEDPRIKELDDSDEEAPKLITNANGKGKNKRAAPESSDDEEPNLDDLMAKSLKTEAISAAPATNGAAKKLSKAEKKAEKKAKKQKTTAVDGVVDASASDIKKLGELKKESDTNGTPSEKKVQFAKNLEQGPTPSATPPVSSKTAASATTSTVKDVQGVLVDDRKIGQGPPAKKGSRLEMRYIGKLEDGKQFDANKKGKPFSFKLGAGEVIQGFDIGLLGLKVGGERRLTIPAHLAYGSKGMPGIPSNSKLIFDVKLLSLK